MTPCVLCPQRHNCVPPSGPRNVRVIFVGEAPGVDEDKKLIPFVGKTGKEVNQGYLPSAFLRRGDCYFTNAIKCLPDTPKHKLDMKKQEHKDLLLSCANSHLYNEICSISPKLIVAMGAFACYAIDPNIDLELHHGIPVQSQWGITVFPMWHPAQGIHEPKKMLQIRTDWVRLGWYLKGKLGIAVDEYPNPDYAEVTDPDEIDELDPWSDMAADTEWSRSLGPYVMTYSQIPGKARLIRASRKDILKRLQERINIWRALVFFHNWLYDRSNVEGMGLVFPDKIMRDTMIRIFHLGNLPQGLKTFAYRELGMFMQDFDDLVKPYSREHVINYFRLAQLYEWPKPEPRLVLDEKTGLWKTKKPHRLNTKLKTFFTYLEKNPDKDVFEAWDNWEEEQEMVEAQIGPWPGKDIAHVPFEEMLWYACRDAHATLLAIPILEQMRKRVRKFKQEEWRVYAKTR